MQQNPVKKIRIGITVVGKDKEGIVAAFTNFIFQKNGNIEKVNQNVIRGLFGMHLEASFSGRIDVKKFDYELQSLGKKLGMEVSIYHEINSHKNIAVFVTKEPHCLQALLDAKDKLKGNISVIVGTEKTLEPMAKKAKIPFVLVDEKDQQKAEHHLIEITKKYDIDLVVLARYMRIMTPNFVWRYPHRIINIHPSLLPAFPGAFAYAQAFERGTKIVGVTAHYVTEELDQGPIIFQDSFKVDSADSLEVIKKKGQKLEADTLLKAVKMHLEGRLEVSWRKVYTR
ncbi:Formyl transferase domain protein [Candidatus Nitrosotenuis uzonensis]|uniref:Formyl transferase domain protein n=1 Tax=Candidatus Nitrosotenuis uzonensis TaxID=1407055 RepID=V6AR95_9ARCH|nr:Formyl transferase domain protein [Candidatus Nitrosotenuis uzonensis]CDI05104.1 Formyl transferase domain protein [Candidatus Nitrosotenuis uzonensis]